MGKTLKELDVKPGDVVEAVERGTMYFFQLGERYTVFGDDENPSVNGCRSSIQDGSCNWKFRIISRASDTPKLWRDMTPEEKGALLLAAHEGKVVEMWSGNGWWSPCALASPHYAYRIRPEPKVETVVLYTGAYADWLASREPVSDDTHSITFNTIDGKPDPASVKMDTIK